MIDSAGDLIDPILRGIGKVVSWTVRLMVEALFDALFEILGGVFNFYSGGMERRGWPAWVYVPLAILLTPLSLIVPIVGLAAIGLLVLGIFAS
ncbi:hypothetical protein [Dongia rigui]|uniref:Uncharacterized protein n=1 Tax=Dongia rigui TaxID=940149 RepID=A0ABU5DU79_9PROT|nr:hypothetical protein [Dongia rigui]MDY0870852.1 hypothetical protein [Dongia rigui]